MSGYSLEPGENLWSLICKCCGKEKNRVMGLVYKYGSAHAKYYALLNVAEERHRVGLTLSVGPWSDSSARSARTSDLDSELSERSWAHLDVWSEYDGTHMDIRHPNTSSHYPWEKGGAPLTREQARVSSAIQEIWSVAAFVIDTDPAVSSYLNGRGVNPVGRELRQARHPARCC